MGEVTATVLDVAVDAVDSLSASGSLAFAACAAVVMTGGAVAMVVPAVAEMRTVRPPELTSSSPIPVRCTSRISCRNSDSSTPFSSATRGVSAARFAEFRPLRAGAGRRLAMGGRAGQVAGEGAEAQEIAVGAEPLDDAQDGTRDERPLPDGLAGRRVREVHLDRGHGHRGERVPERQTGVGQGTRVDQDPARAGLRCVHGVDQNTFMVALAALDLAPELRRQVFQSLIDLGERDAPVDRGLTLTERVEIRTVEDQDLVHGTPRASIVALPLPAGRLRPCGRESGAAR